MHACIREAAKNYFLNGSAIQKKGEGGNGLAIMKKKTFLGTFFIEKVPTAIKLDGGGG